LRDFGLTGEVDDIVKWLDGFDPEDYPDRVGQPEYDKRGRLWHSIVYRVASRGLPTFVPADDNDPVPPSEIAICYVILTVEERQRYEAKRPRWVRAGLRGYRLLAFVDRVIEPPAVNHHA
jgi:hypothetical protein